MAYSTKEFEEQFTYTGQDLGAVWSKEKTVFRVWAPTAISVRVRLYRSGILGADDLLGQLEMRPDRNGTWVAEKSGDLNGVYYTYLVDRESIVKETCDPYARAVGVNGGRAMVIDLAETDPEGWDRDRNPQAGKSIVDAVVYELHVRDLSADPASGIRNTGKFLGLTERGTRTPEGEPTGLDHIQSMGVTHVQLLPVYDFGSVDESRPEVEQYNWGYDPVNYNVPEGSYATDAESGAVRIRELKQAIQAIHNAGMGVVMDVVYNHVYDRNRFCFNRIVPNYFSRTDAYGQFSQGSGCGNDTASERSMVRKYIVDSVKYWAEEYHMDGFRFDLAGLLDVETIRQAMEEVHKTRPDVLFYGEGWNMNTWMTKENVPLVNQKNAEMLPGFAFFNDSFRDTIKGTVFDNDAPGYVSGALDQESWVRECVMGLNDWCKTPEQTINYVSCHDNMALFDRLTQSAPYAEDSELVSMNKLAAATCLLSQGIPLFQAGEEILRSKPLPDGTFDENSYRSPDSVNSIKWGNLKKKTYRDVRDYYKGLIAFRKEHGALRMRSARAVMENIICLDTKLPNVTAFQIRGAVENEPDEAIIMVFNPTVEKARIKLPAGDWSVCINGNRAGTETLAVVRGWAEAAPISPLVLVKRRKKMIYQTVCGDRLSALGFGAMRLPTLADGTIDEPLVEKMVAYAMDHGINYFDTAVPYHSGMSEIVMGRVLSRYPRESYRLADKFPGHQIASGYDPKAIFEEQLKKCGVEYFDYYLLHNVYEKSIETYLDPRWGIMEYFIEQKRLGRIRHLGFSTHGRLELIRRFLDLYGEHMEFCQIQLNYLDWTLQDAKAKYELLESRGIPVWVMEPVRGGKLAKLADTAEAKLKELRPNDSVPGWCFRFLQGLPNVKMILSGMSNMDHVVDNIRTFETSAPLNSLELAAVMEIAESMKNSVPCTACRYCTDGCPKGLDIPTLIAILNDLRVAPVTNTAMMLEFAPEEKRPSACIACGKCSRICPQGIDIPGVLAELTEVLKTVPSWAAISKVREEEQRKLRETLK